MINGTCLLEGYVPDVDATIVTHILDAGEARGVLTWGDVRGRTVLKPLTYAEPAMLSCLK
jgi:hypothetical protein